MKKIGLIFGVIALLAVVVFFTTRRLQLEPRFPVFLTFTGYTNDASGHPLALCSLSNGYPFRIQIRQSTNHGYVWSYLQHGSGQDLRTVESPLASFLGSTNAYVNGETSNWLVFALSTNREENISIRLDYFADSRARTLREQADGWWNKVKNGSFSRRWDTVLCDLPSKTPPTK